MKRSPSLRSCLPQLRPCARPLQDRRLARPPIQIYRSAIETCLRCGRVLEHRFRDRPRRQEASRLDLSLLKSKSATFVWEEFTRLMYQTPDIAVQGQFLNEVVALIEAGKRGCKSSTRLMASGRPFRHGPAVLALSLCLWHNHEHGALRGSLRGGDTELELPLIDDLADGCLIQIGRSSQRSLHLCGGSDRQNACVG